MYMATVGIDTDLQWRRQNHQRDLHQRCRRQLIVIIVDVIVNANASSPSYTAHRSHCHQHHHQCMIAVLAWPSASPPPSCRHRHLPRRLIIVNHHARPNHLGHQRAIAIILTSWPSSLLRRYRHHREDDNGDGDDKASNGDDGGDVDGDHDEDGQVAIWLLV